MKKNLKTYAKVLLRKSGNDLVAARAILATGKALDAACFHTQQAVEKSLKAFLAFHGVRFPFRHDLRELLALALPHLPALKTDEDAILELSPFAVEIRYDDEILPSKSTAARSVRTAEKIHRLLAGHIRKRPRHK